jgi:hypothetical protein
LIVIDNFTTSFSENYRRNSRIVVISASLKENLAWKKQVARDPVKQAVSDVLGSKVKTSTIFALKIE